MIFMSRLVLIEVEEPRDNSTNWIAGRIYNVPYTQASFFQKVRDSQQSSAGD